MGHAASVGDPGSVRQFDKVKGRAGVVNALTKTISVEVMQQPTPADTRFEYRRTNSDERLTSSFRISANYGLVRERLLGWTPTAYQCRLFCGGPHCKYCVPNAFPLSEQALPGIFSTWITDNLLAMSRPTELTIKQFDLLTCFRKQGVTTIINLQHPYEHKHCGQPFPPNSNFSYNPEDLMKNNIYYYNFGWPDFGVSTVTCLLNMVKVLQFAVAQGKVAVHCHAGLGRTGVLICAFLIWQDNLTSSKAIEYVRSKRPGSVQTTAQVQMVRQFENFLHPLIRYSEHKLTYEQHLRNQRLLLHGDEARLLKHVAKSVFVCCERLLELFGVNENMFLHKKLVTLLPTDDVRLCRSAGMTRFLTEVKGRTIFPSLSSKDDTDPDAVADDPARVIATLNDNVANRNPITAVFSERTAIQQSDENASEVSNEDFLRIFEAVVSEENGDEQMETFMKNLCRRSFTARWQLLAQDISAENILQLLRYWFMCLKEPIIPDGFGFDSANDTAKDLPKSSKWTLIYCMNVFNRLCSNVDDRKPVVCRYLAQCFTGQYTTMCAAEHWILATMNYLREMQICDYKQQT